MTAPPAPAPTAPPVLTAMTGIRALAAGAVVLYHLRDQLFVLLPGLRVLDTWLAAGFLGVDVFFVLSGFIISYNYAHRFASVDRRRYGRYLWMRFARIYPVHLFTLLGTAAAVGAAAILGVSWGTDQPRTAVGFAGNLIMLQALPGIEPWNGAAWSISCEAAAYLAFPFFAAGLLALRRRWALVLLALTSFAFVGAVTMVSGIAGSPHVPLYWTRIAGEFSMGCLLWAAWRHGVRRHWRWDLVAVAALVVVAVLLAVPATRSIYWIVVPVLALSVVSTASAAGPWERFLASRPMEWGGRISYSLYLVHFAALSILYLLLPPTALAGAGLPVRVGTVAAYLVGAVVAAAATYYLVEEPARGFLRRWSVPRTPEPAQRASDRDAERPRHAPAGGVSR